MKDTQMAPHVRKTVEEIDGDIVALQTDLQRLTDMRTGLVDLYGGESVIPKVPVRGTELKRADRKIGAPKKERAGAVAGAPKKGKAETGTSAALGVGNAINGEPETLGAAMKLVAKQLGKFTGDELRQAVKEKYLRLFEEVGPTAFCGNLKYWSSKGKLTQSGEGKESVYTVVNLDF